jgi:hypothetical protein
LSGYVGCSNSTSSELPISIELLGRLKMRRIQILQIIRSTRKKFITERTNYFEISKHKSELNTKEAELSLGKNCKHPQMHLRKPDDKILRPEADLDGTGLKQNTGRGCGAVPDPRCRAPLWIERCGTVGRRRSR